MEPRVRPDIEEFLRVCNGLLQYLTDEECEEMACIVYFVRQKTLRPYDDLDNLAASLAFSTLPATFD
jgi:hypothetical protein